MTIHEKETHPAGGSVSPSAAVELLPIIDNRRPGPNCDSCRIELQHDGYIWLYDDDDDCIRFTPDQIPGVVQSLKAAADKMKES